MDTFSVLVNRLYAHDILVALQVVHDLHFALHVLDLLLRAELRFRYGLARELLAGALLHDQARDAEHSFAQHYVCNVEIAPDVEVLVREYQALLLGFWFLFSRCIRGVLIDTDSKPSSRYCTC